MKIKGPIFLDNHLIAVYKPFGIPVQPDKSDQISLLELTKNWIKNEFSKPGNVFLGLLHRIDRPVAGIVLFARTSKAAARLSAQFRENAIDKFYQVIVSSPPDKPDGTLIHYLRKEKKLKATVFSRKTAGAKRAELMYRTLKATPNGNILEVQLKTGRFHQIRSQLAFIGSPIVGDVKYGSPFPIAEKKIGLFADRLILKHPVTNMTIEIKSPIPKEWPFWS